ncbi:LysR family transcriptional regulator [Alcanivorax sp. JB21]|uniref:LysR substrate-binding domain-containing protein n=1 Tax=Alcanivorax limicola TaxID=2874102 RepID=UPI001CBCA095|nr:LysR substrate-binding domain-containing protein [Alcanivorax limicola]MBZ2189054.1 LysR family transcriptional regulator [Alcanivorax limicola]
MTLTELRYLVALAREKHFGRAADACHVSQPTLSAAIRKLEEHLGLSLFERRPREVRVTVDAEPIIAQAQRVLEQVELLEQLADTQRDQLGAPLRVGAIFTVAPYLFPEMVPKVRKGAPDMPLFIEENYTHVLRGKLDRGELDAIIVALPFSGGGLVRAKMYEESFSVLLPAGHPWEKQKAIRPEQLLEETLLLLGEGHCFRDQVLELCPAIDSEKQKHLVQIEGGSLETLRHMVAGGLGITILPDSALRHSGYRENAFSVRPFIKPAPTRTIALVWRDSFPRPKAIEVLRQAVPRLGLTSRSDAA